jgi:hypothetical protein
MTVFLEPTTRRPERREERLSSSRRRENMTFCDFLYQSIDALGHKALVIRYMADGVTDLFNNWVLYTESVITTIAFLAR